MINLSLISPSSVGQYAACTKRLVYDSSHPKKRGSSSAADFGTVCHYTAMTLLGCGPLDPPSDACIESAASRYASIEDMAAQAERCATFANTKLPALAPGTRWIAELNVHDTSLLPERINRRGEKKGYGGNIDLMMSDQSHVVDYKFTGELPEYAKVEYLWQMGSYSFLKDVPLTTILWTTRDAMQAVKLTIDWRLPAYAALRDDMRTFIHRCGLADFERYAYPVAGNHCDWCDHKARCGAYQALHPVFDHDVPFIQPKTNLSAIDEMRKLLALRAGMSPQSKEQQLASAVGLKLEDVKSLPPPKLSPSLDVSTSAREKLF